MKGAQPCDSDLKERFLSFVCLFIFAIRISRLILFTFLASFRIFPSAFSHLHPQVSGPRFTDTPLDTVNSEQCFDARIAG